MTGSDQGSPPSQISEAQFDELTKDWREETRDAARFVYLEGFECMECGMRKADWSFLFGLITHLQAENAAMRGIVEAVAEVEWSTYCPWCNRHGTMHEVEHYEDCPVLAARALTGVTPPDEDAE